MSNTSATNPVPVPPQEGQAPLTTALVVRQVVVIVVILAIWTAVLVGYLALTNPSEEKTPAASPASPEATEISFSEQVLPIFEARCQQCHAAGRAEAGVNLSSHAGVMAGASYGPVVIPGNAETSILVQVIVSGEMPLGGRKLTDSEIQTISDWLDAGAPDN